MQQLINGLAVGAIYGLVALALVLIFRATSILNFAQGEMATFTTFLAWTLIARLGVPFWPAFVITLAIAAALGLVTYLVVIRPVERAPEFTVVMVTFGLFYIFNGLSQSLWSAAPKAFPTPFNGGPIHVLGAVVSRPYVGIFAITIVMTAALVALLRGTKLGLGMRATAQNPAAARLVGIHTTRMYAFGWMLAAMVGAVAGMLIANVLSLYSSLMLDILIFAVLGMIMGGMTSPVGAMIGGLLVGVIASFAGSYAIGYQLSTPFMVGVILLVLLVRPQGLLGKRAQTRV